MIQMNRNMKKKKKVNNTLLLGKVEQNTFRKSIAKILFKSRVYFAILL